MNKIKVIKRDNLPARLPVISSIVVYLFLDHTQAPGFVWGAVGAVFVVWWVVNIIILFKSDYIDILKTE